MSADWDDPSVGWDDLSWSWDGTHEIVAAFDGTFVARIIERWSVQISPDRFTVRENMTV